MLSRLALQVMASVLFSLNISPTHLSSSPTIFLHLQVLLCNAVSLRSSPVPHTCPSRSSKGWCHALLQSPVCVPVTSQRLHSPSREAGTHQHLLSDSLPSASVPTTSLFCPQLPGALLSAGWVELIPEFRVLHSDPAPPHLHLSPGHRCCSSAD